MYKRPVTRFVVNIPRSGFKPGRGIRASLWIVAFLVLLALLFIPDHIFAQKKKRRPDPVRWYSLNTSVRKTDGTEVRTRLKTLLVKPNVKLFLKTIQKAEGGEPYLMVGGCRAKTLKFHPARTVPRRCWFPIRYRGMKYSTAAGKYQITHTNWREIAPFLGLGSFSEVDQDLAALELIRRGGGAAGSTSPTGMAIKHRIQGGFIDLVNGKVSRPLCTASYDWASSSCSPLPARTKINYAKLAAKISQPVIVRKKRRGR